MKKVLITIGSVLILAVVVFHVLWFLNFNRYTPFKKTVGKDMYGRYCTHDEDMCSYAVFPPPYPLFSEGNLAISDFYSNDLKPGDKLVDMIIWLGKNDSYKVGFVIKVVVSNEKTPGDMTNIQTDGYSYTLDEKKNFIKEPDEEELAFFNENKDIIDKYYDKAYKMWGILG